MRLIDEPLPDPGLGEPGQVHDHIPGRASCPSVAAQGDPDVAAVVQPAIAMHTRRKISREVEHLIAQHGAEALQGVVRRPVLAARADELIDVVAARARARSA